MGADWVRWKGEEGLGGPGIISEQKEVWMVFPSSQRYLRLTFQPLGAGISRLGCGPPTPRSPLADRPVRAERLRR